MQLRFSFVCVQTGGCDLPNFALESCTNLSRVGTRETATERSALGNEPTLVALMEAAGRGNRSASDALFSALYSELRRLAKYELARRGAPMSLSATTLLHKAYIEIAGKEGTSFPDRNRFMGYAARVMRGLIIDHARSRRAQKRGGQFEITSLGAEIENAVDDRKLARISEALDELAKAEPAAAEIVDLKFFCGFSFAEIGAMRHVCERTVQRQWEKARIYLHRSIRADLET
jgi:RNA polymerase sigma factor (TIGR02999 family)